VELAALAGWLAAAGLEEGSVVIGAEVERRWCVCEVRTGDEPGGGSRAWDVFWCEDGARFEWTRFDDESTACFALFGRLAWTQVARGALVPRSGPRSP
jgi:hypothetical protein